MDSEKVAAIRNWPTPTNHKQLQRFLGFANIYVKFIWNLSSIASLLHRLTSVKTHFLWTKQAFQTLKDQFTTAPVLAIPNPKWPVHCGVGCLRSWNWSGAVPAVWDRLHPCAFLSKKLAPAERNYDVRNQQLLAVKVALEEDIGERGRSFHSSSGQITRI